jgi:hypothetical protein
MLEATGYIISTHTKGDWAVTSPKGVKVVFKRGTGMCSGMPYIDLQVNQEGISVIETVAKSIAGATNKETERVILSRTGQRRIGHPQDELFKEIVCLGQNGLTDCPIEVSDINTSNVFFGPNRPSLRGAKTRNIQVLRTKEQRITIPREFYRLHKRVTITADVMFVSGIPYNFWPLSQEKSILDS